MSCLPTTGKCEWLDLRHFVERYNQVNQASFERTACLDVENRTCPMPEILCTDQRTQAKLLVERKVLTWPPNYFVQHESLHRFFEDVHRGLGPAIRSGRYELTIEEPHLDGKETRTRLARDLAVEIGKQELPLELSSIHGDQPFPWVLRHQSSSERDEEEPGMGLGIRVDQAVDTSIENPQAVSTELRDQIQGALESAARKFNRAPSGRKVLLLQLIPTSLGIQLDQKWWTEYLKLVPIPTEIDEIWTGQNYDGDWEFTAVFQR